MEGSKRPQVIAREVPAFSNLSGSKDDELGCCGYPDVIYKSKTTSPIFNSSNIPPVFKNQEEEPQMRGVPQVFAQPASNGSPVNQVDFSRLNSVHIPMGQTPSVEIPLRREAPGSMLTVDEAGQLSIELSTALFDAGLALEGGVGCVGLDVESIDEATRILDVIVAFSEEGGGDEGLVLEPEEITAVERILECSNLYRKLESERKNRSLAFVAGGVALGAIILIAAAS